MSGCLGARKVIGDSPKNDMLSISIYLSIYIYMYICTTSLQRYCMIWALAWICHVSIDAGSVGWDPSLKSRVQWVLKPVTSTAYKRVQVAVLASRASFGRNAIVLVKVFHCPNASFWEDLLFRSSQNVSENDNEAMTCQRYRSRWPRFHCSRHIRGSLSLL